MQIPRAAHCFPASPAMRDEPSVAAGDGQLPPLSGAFGQSEGQNSDEPGDLSLLSHTALPHTPAAGGQSRETACSSKHLGTFGCWRFIFIVH